MGKIAFVFSARAHSTAEWARSFTIILPPHL
mgnify:CR=1 FL=1